MGVAVHFGLAVSDGDFNLAPVAQCLIGAQAASRAAGANFARRAR
jgi:hypothetical protein